MIFFDSRMVNENREDHDKNIFFYQNAKIFLSFLQNCLHGKRWRKNPAHISTGYPKIPRRLLENPRITCREKNEAQATSWLPAPFRQVVVLDLVAV